MGAVATWQWLVGVGLVLASSFFSGTETALTALGDARARHLVETGGRRARLLRLWLEHPERVLSTVLVGNTLVNIAAGAIAGDVASTVAGSEGTNPATTLAVATALATAVVLFFGEILPKTLSKRYPVQVSLTSIPLVYPLYWLLWPVSTAATRAVNALLRAVGVKSAPAPVVTGAEIEYLIEVGTREGVLDEVKEELLNSVLEFADRVVKEIMVPRTRMVALDREAPPEEVLRVVTENPYSRMPVYHGTVDNVVGILLVRDIVQELKNGPLPAIPLDKSLKPPYFVPEQMKISRLLKEMQRRKTHMAVVVDEFGGTSGLVTLEDVLEEIVGEIQDEADAESAPVKALGDGLYLADATVPLRDLEEYLSGQGGEGSPGLVRFPDDGDYETLGGFVIATAGRVPPVGAAVDWDGLTLTVRAGDERRVTRVEIARKAASPARPLPAPERAAR
ncbi:MAG TPA: hemolysin family protein [Anaeromyxobacteraceae bacterium]|nr:hemolysin family protein [Anaeromyxobacteraceae bacterium]